MSEVKVRNGVGNEFRFVIEGNTEAEGILYETFLYVNQSQTAAAYEKEDLAEYYTAEEIAVNPFLEYCAKPLDYLRIVWKVDETAVLYKIEANFMEVFNILPNLVMASLQRDAEYCVKAEAAYYEEDL